jgi:AraC-like DNA-binding protein
MAYSTIADVLVATSELQIGAAKMRSTLLLERAVRATIVVRDSLMFDTRFGASEPGKDDSVGYVFMLAAGRWRPDRGEPIAAPVAFILRDEEIERVTPKSRTFRTDGAKVTVIQLRFPKRNVKLPIGIEHGPIAMSPACWGAANAIVDEPHNIERLRELISALAAAGVTDDIAATLCSEEPEPFRRLWSALEPLYQRNGATTSIKQIAASLGMSMRQVGRDAKELVATFGLGNGYREALLTLRLRVAALMLSAPEATVAEVARLVGYGSPIAMARAFRDARLPSPSAVQDALRGE